MDQKRNISCRKQHNMNVADDARLMVAAIAGERAWGDTRQSWLARAARRLGWPYSRTRGVFYRRVVVRADEWLELNEALAQLQQSAARRQGEINEIKTLERAAVAAPVDPVRPLELAGDDAGQARLRKIGKT
jgi:hypothetical protein